MRHTLLLLILFGCQSVENKIESALERECGKGVALVSYEMVGDSYLDTVRLRMIDSEFKYFEGMARLRAEQAKDNANMVRLSRAAGSNLGGIFKDDALKYAAEMKAYIDSLEMMTRLDSVIKQRIKERGADDLRYFLAKGVMMSGDSVWRLFDKDMRTVKVKL